MLNKQARYNPGKSNILIVFLGIILIFSGCKSSGEYQADRETPISEVMDSFSDELSLCKEKSYDNLDMSDMKAGELRFTECHDLSLTIDNGNTGQDGKKLCEAFEKNCMFYFHEFDPMQAYFSSSKDDQLYLAEKNSAEGVQDDGNYTWYPSYQKYKTELENGELHADAFLYRDIKKNQYLWWVLKNGPYPCWVNCGKAYGMLKSKDSKISSWLPSDITKEKITFYHDGENDRRSYSLSGKSVSIGEAVSYFEDQYVKNLPFAIDGRYSLSVSSVDVIELKKKQYAYILNYSPSWAGIHYDRIVENYSQTDRSHQFSSMGQAIMVQKDQIDMITDFILFPVTEKQEHSQIISFQDAVALLHRDITSEVTFEVKSVELVYQGNYQKKYTIASLSPAWKFVAFNPNDNLYYDFYIDAVNRKITSYPYSHLGE